MVGLQRGHHLPRHAELPGQRQRRPGPRRSGTVTGHFHRLQCHADSQRSSLLRPPRLHGGLPHWRLSAPHRHLLLGQRGLHRSNEGAVATTPVGLLNPGMALQPGTINGKVSYNADRPYAGSVPSTAPSATRPTWITTNSWCTTPAKRYPAHRCLCCLTRSATFPAAAGLWRLRSPAPGVNAFSPLALCSLQCSGHQRRDERPLRDRVHRALRGTTMAPSFGTVAPSICWRY